MTAPSQHLLKLFVEPGTFAIVSFPAGAAIPFEYHREFFSLTQTRDELSLVCNDECVPAGVKAERGRALLRVAGPLDFSLTGILASLTRPLAEAGVSVFALSTFNTDYVLVRQEDLPRSIAALERAGHSVQRSFSA